MLLVLALCCALPLSAGAEADAAARIAELEAQLAERDARIAELEAQLGIGAFADGDAAAEFEGGVITVEEARAEYEYRAYYYTSFGLEAGDYNDVIKQEVLESLVEDAILRAKAEEYGLYGLSREDQEAIERQAEQSFEDTVAYYMGFRAAEGKTDAEVRQETIEYLAGEDYTLEGVVRTLTNQTWRDRLYDYVTRDVQLTDEALAGFYEREVTSAELTYSADPLEYEYARMDGATVLWNPEGYRRVKAILVGFSPEAQIALAGLRLELDNTTDEAERARVQGEIDSLYTGLDPIVSEVLGRVQAGDDFMLLVDEYSADDATRTEPTRTSGYYVSANSQVYMAGFPEAAMALANIGDISAPVRTDLGYYIIRYEGDVTPGPVPFDEVKEQLAASALEDMRDQLYNSTVEQWLADAHIVYHPDRF